jgi:hypothetical protein
MKWTDVDILKIEGECFVRLNECKVDRGIIEQCEINPHKILSLQKNDSSRKIIRNMNYMAILNLTIVTNTCKSKISLWKTLTEAYNNLILQDRFFAPSSIELFLERAEDGGIKYNNFFYLIQQYQPKASILNPYTINWTLRNIFKGSRLFTPVLSWGSYMCAFMHADNWEHYVGIDVMESVCNNCVKMYDYYNKYYPEKVLNKKVNIYCGPSESFAENDDFLFEYTNYFDSAIICPPYFDMDIYHEGEQSINNYPDYSVWLIKYWTKTVHLTHNVVRVGGMFGLIINNYVSLKGKTFNLIGDLNEIALNYFKLVDYYHLVNRGSPLRVNKKNRTEMLFIYQKI